MDELRKLGKKLDIEKNDVDGFSGMVIHACKDNEYTPIVYIIGDEKELLNVVNTMSHEATHIMQQYYRGLTEREPGLEAQAYLVGNVTQALVGMWLERTKKKETKE